ncbi:tRNA-splicing ligase RtcB [Chitinophaga skermanii]|uniref:3'-phosphate/5'-hydroxy nucleic acid ligase n=1 Tax=Chitinophaga skermanii TaxID=331697 RepID=A0A327QW46_9BACT|nr:RtcB family protein [Chitinophaga skermanii]RAJ08590.1 tRNA-splicing ligase RtcB [Chitinophaga skermanii]
MGQLKAKTLSKIGYTNDQARSLALNILSKHYKHDTNEALIDLLTDIKNNPNNYLQHEVLGKIAEQFTGKEVDIHWQTFDLLAETGMLKIFGGKCIEHSAKKQMETAMSLPITMQGALMPDAHAGYGLPIGGVLATKNAVIPYAVGVDIGCRMSLSIIDEDESFFKRYSYQMKVALKEQTHFGMEGGLEFHQEHPVLDDARFDDTAFLKRMQIKAARQLGSSGGGNHFVEFGLIDMPEGNDLQLPAKSYVALLSHSGSRGLGATIAQHYTQIAMQTCKLPRSAQSLAWLDLDTEAGQEYWLSMNLAGDYAKACHEAIHYNLLKSLGLKAMANINNHHNFAWKDTLPSGEEAIIHRKGATPAHAGEWGIIPGSMTTAAYLVKGLGNEAALYSASHGAGRAMSRQQAKQKMTVSALKKILADAGVTLIGGSVEENPFAYKDIETVMAAQTQLVNVQGRFLPKIVRMHKE